MSEVRRPEASGSSEASVLSLSMAIFSLRLHVVFAMCVFVYVLIFFLF